MPRPKWGAAMLVLAIALVYGGSLGAPFQLDDLESITGNASIRDLASFAWLNPPATHGETVSGRPLLNGSFALNHALGGLEVRGYRAVNVLIHALAALTLFGVIARTLTLVRRRASPGAGEVSGRAFAARWIALALAAIWALHPLQTGAVTYVVQRAESLAGLFYLLVLYGFIRAATPAGGRNEPSSPAPWAGWSVLTVLACLGGVLTKETVASAPLLVLLYDRTFVAGSLRAAWRARWRLYLALASTWLVLGALVLANRGRGGSAGFDAAIGPWTYLLTQCEAILHYLGLVIWPRGQVFDYGVATVSGVAEVWPQALALVALAVAGGWSLYRNRSAGFLIAAFFLLLAPSSSFVPVATQTMAEHRMYLPLAAVIGLMGWSVARFGRWAALRPAAGVAVKRGVGVALVAVIAVALGVATFARNQVYATDLALWGDTAAKRPDNPRAHHNLGLALEAAGRLEDAMAEYRRAIALQPNHAFAHCSLGVALLKRGQPGEALPHLQAALAADPDYTAARVNLGRALAQLGRIDAAMAEYQTVLAVEPEATDARTSLAALLVTRGRAEEAAAMLRQVIATSPALAEAHYHLGLALEQLRQPAEAENALRTAIELKPGWAGAWLALGTVLARRGDAAGAERAYREALRFEPRLAGAHYALGNVLAQRRDFGAAIDEFVAALAIDPAHVQARNNLGNCQLVTGRIREAVATYEESLRLRPDDAAVRQNLQLARELLRGEASGGR